MKKLESKEFYYQTDPIDGQIYLFEFEEQIDPKNCGKALLTVLVEESNTLSTASPIDVKDLIYEMADLENYYCSYGKSSYDSPKEVHKGISLLLNRIKSGVLHEKS